MTRLATMGTSSCATIAIAHFKGKNKDLNDQYLADPSSFVQPEGGMTVQEFYDDILYPTDQELGCTGEYPFRRLMEEIDKSAMKDKFIIATLNASQYNFDDEYWPKQLAECGFEVIDKTNNKIGQLCYIFARNKGRP